MNKKPLLYYFVFILCIMLNPLFSFSQWTSNISVNTPICTSLNNQKDYSVVSDTKGGAIIIWNDKRNNVLRSDIYAQRINSLGILKWTSQGIGVCTSTADQANPSTVEDGNGGVIIAWDDSTNGDRDIYAQRLDSSGNPKWALNGVPIVLKANKQKSVKIISDGVGGAIAVWEDSLAGFWDIYAQRINSSGVTMWTTGGVPVCTAIMNQKNPRLVTDGSGGAYITWQDRRSAIDYDIYVQHINSTGTAMFAVDGIAVCTAIDKQTDPKIVSERLGGAIITWQDKRGGIYYDVYAQRISSAGTLQWLANGAAVCTADSSQTSIDITSDNISGAIITWRDKRNGLYHDIYAQKINMTGTTAWQLNGIKISNTALTQTSPNICGDGSGGAIIAWQDSTVGNWDIRSQRINSSGICLWNSGGNIVTNANNVQTNPKNISDGLGGCIYIWQDYRNVIDDDIYAQHFTSLGVEAIFNESFLINNNISIYPNPVIESAYIRCNNEQIDFTKCSGIIYDDLGRIINSMKIENAKIYIKDIRNGVYYLKIVEKGTTIPVTMTSIVRTVEDNQVSAGSTIYFGENERASKNKAITKMTLKGIPKMPAGQAKMKYIFTIDIYGKLNMTKYSLDNGRRVTATANLINLLEDE